LVFKEGDIHGVIYFSSDWRITLITFLIRGVTKEDALERLGIKFGAVIVMDVNKGGATKDFEWWSEEKERICIYKDMTGGLKF